MSVAESASQSVDHGFGFVIAGGIPQLGLGAREEMRKLGWAMLRGLG